MRVFFCEDTGRRRLSRTWSCKSATCAHLTREDVGVVEGNGRSEWPDDSVVGPICEECGGPTKIYSTGASTILRRSDTGEEITRPNQYPGACYESFSERKGPDGRALTVICPNGHAWSIDGRASNCTMPDDEEHRCWVRHGRPEDGTLHVDKNGHTCGAGGGSIIAGDYHGFLHNGEFRQC